MQFVPDPWVWCTDLDFDQFVLGMLDLGSPVGTSLVGVFDTAGLGSRRDMEQPLHQDGVYSEEFARLQGGVYVEQPDIDFVGLYCLRAGERACYTTLGYDGAVVEKINLSPREALIIDNRAIQHGRAGSVGSRLLVRMWVRSLA